MRLYFITSYNKETSYLGIKLGTSLLYYQFQSNGKCYKGTRGVFWYAPQELV